MADSPTLSKANILKPAEDYNNLRAKGLNLIEQLGSNLWTNYNFSDPGITIFEAVCYAITDLSYRTGFEMKDLLAPEKLTADTWNEIFYTARNILSNNPVTLDDYRKIIIDVVGVPNAWVFTSNDYEVPIWIDYNHFEERIDPNCQCENPEKQGCFGKLSLKADATETSTSEEDKKLLDKEKSEIEDAIEDLLKKQGKIEADIQALGIELENLENPQPRKGKKVALKDADAIKRVQAELNKLKKRQANLKNELDKLYEEEGYIHERIDKSSAIPAEILEMKGLYKVMLEYEENVVSDEDKEKVRDKVMKRLMKDRNLCEDFLSVDEVEYEDFGINASISLTEDADPDVVMAQIFFTLYTYFTPSVPFYTIAQMQAKGYTIDEIFDGPALTHGFIDTGDLDNTALYRNLDLSQILTDIQQIPGVTAITYFHLIDIPIGECKCVDSNYFAVWVQYLQQQQKVAQIDPSQSKVIFCKQTDCIRYNTGASNDRSSARMLKLYKDLQTAQLAYKLQGFNPDIPVPMGEWMNLADYYPVTYSLPATYGVKDTVGLPANAGLTRQYEALQLQGYLMFFEQIMADYLVQLNSLKELFSFSGQKHTYFTRAVTDIQNLNALINAGSITDFANEIQKLSETPEAFDARRNLFLNHMLARFGEDLSAYEALVELLWPATCPKRFIVDKMNMLQKGEYPLISSNRGKAYNYTLPDTWDTDNTSGAERRIGRLLGFSNVKRHTLATDLIKINSLLVTDPASRQTVQKKTSSGAALNVIQIVDDNGVVLLTSVPVMEGCCSELLLEKILQFADNNLYYKLSQSSNGTPQTTATDQSFELYDGTDFPNATLLARSANGTLQQLQEYIGRINNNEGIHLVEHLLLRPKLDKVLSANNDSQAVRFLDICLDECDLQRLKNVPSTPPCYKKKVTRIPADECYEEKPWRLEYVDDSDESLLCQSVDVKTQETYELIFKTYELLVKRVLDLNQYGSDSVNYAIVQDSTAGTQWGFIIYGENQTVLACSQMAYENENDVQTAINDPTTGWVAYFGYMLNLYCCQETCDGNEDPYSLRATVILPCWPKRFSQTSFRNLVQQTVLSQLPAHIQANVFWLDISEMQRFEAAYKPWLAAMSVDSAMPQYAVVNNLVEVINTLKPCCACDDGCDDAQIP